jgi:integrase
MASVSIVKRTRANGKPAWEVVVTRPDPVTGKPKQTTQTFDRERDAKKSKAEILVGLSRGEWVARSDETVADVLLHWLEHDAKHGVREATYVSYKLIVEKHLLPGLGSIPVQKLTPDLVRTFYSKKLGDGASVRTVRFCHLHLGQALEVALRDGKVTRKVTDAVNPPRQVRKEMVIWSPAETQRFLEVAVGSSYGPIWLVIAGTGMRRGEALGLRWKDIDWERGVIHVRQQVQPIDGKTKIVPYTKDGRGGKSVPVPPALIEALRRHKDQLELLKTVKGEKWQENGLVFPSAVGTPIGPRNLERDFYTLRERAGVPKVRVHDIRHTVATHLIEAGVDIKAVSQHLGHKGVSITREVYQHITEGQRRGVADAIGSIILGDG